MRSFIYNRLFLLAYSSGQDLINVLKLQILSYIFCPSR